MRWLGMIFASLTMLCLLCAPTLAQSSPSASQYEPTTCPPGQADCSTTSSVSDVPEDFVASTEQGTDAVNDAIEDSSPADASAVSGDASAPGVSFEGGSARSSTEEPVEITVLPETGGAPLTVLGSGVLLVTLGLMTGKVVGR